MTRPCSTAATMVAKLSSVSTMSAASLETSVPVTPIATPMSAFLSAGASFTPSPVMATMCLFPCMASIMVSLCSGEIPSREDAPVFGDAKLGRDVPGGQGVVARDHYQSDTRSLAGLYSVPGLGPGRIDHTDHAEEGEAIFEFLPRPVERP